MCTVGREGVVLTLRGFVLRVKAWVPGSCANFRRPTEETGKSEAERGERFQRGHSEESKEKGSVILESIWGTSRRFRFK